MGGKSLASPRRPRRVLAAGASRGRGPLAGRRGSTCARVFGALHRAGPRRVGGRRRVPPVGPGSGCGRWRPAGARRRPCRWPPPFPPPPPPHPHGERVAGAGRQALVAGAGRGRAGRERGSLPPLAVADRARGSRARVAGAGRGRAGRERGRKPLRRIAWKRCLATAHRTVHRQTVAPIIQHCSPPLFPSILILIAWRTAHGPPRGSRQSVAPPSCFDRPRPNPILRSGGGGEQTSERKTMRKSASRQVGKPAGRQVGRSAAVAAVGKLASRQVGRSAGRQVGRSAGRQVGRSAGRQVGQSASRQAGRSAGRPPSPP